MTRRGKRWMIIGSVVAFLLVAFIAVDQLVMSQRGGERAPYAGTYAGPSQQQLQLREDGTWSRAYSSGAANVIEGGQPGGTILDQSWQVVSATQACNDCENPPRFTQFSGAQAIFVPSAAARKKGASVLTMYGDYYGILDGENALVDESGQRWTLVQGR